MQKKKIIFYALFVFLLIILFVLGALSFKQIRTKIIANKSMQNMLSTDISSPFSINKIVYFSSANCTSTINTNSSFTISDLYQYTDIAIFINNNANGNFTAENTLKSVSISNINYNLKPSIGTPNLYFKNLNNFATNTYDPNNIIKDKLDFSTSSEDEIDYTTPTLYNNCANPITLGYVNSNIKSNHTLSDNISNISYDGNLLKQCYITLNSISCKISFTITITNNSNETYTCPLTLTIPLSTENSTVYDGNLTLNDVTNYNFIKI